MPADTLAEHICHFAAYFWVYGYFIDFQWLRNIRGLFRGHPTRTPRTPSRNTCFASVLKKYGLQKTFSSAGPTWCYRLLRLLYVQITFGPLEHCLRSLPRTLGHRRNIPRNWADAPRNSRGSLAEHKNCDPPPPLWPHEGKKYQKIVAKASKAWSHKNWTLLLLFFLSLFHSLSCILEVKWPHLTCWFSILFQYGSHFIWRRHRILTDKYWS